MFSVFGWFCWWFHCCHVWSRRAPLQIVVIRFSPQKTNLFICLNFCKCCLYHISIRHIFVHILLYSLSTWHCCCAPSHVALPDSCTYHHHHQHYSCLLCRGHQSLWWTHGKLQQRICNVLLYVQRQCVCW